ncbi:hypothetical protein Bbelb_249940 [Branchiostoma belcheri]|nr:hypothetical protein Bbelb_249940 [Branchiostoma belcheri]
MSVTESVVRKTDRSRETYVACRRDPGDTVSGRVGMGGADYASRATGTNKSTTCFTALKKAWWRLGPDHKLSSCDRTGCTWVMVQAGWGDVARTTCAETRSSKMAGVCMDGKNERVKIPPKKTKNVRFGEDDMDKVIDLEGGETDDWYVRVGRGALNFGKLRLCGLTMFLCVLWDLSAEDIWLCMFLRDLSPIYETREHRTLT